MAGLLSFYGGYRFTAVPSKPITCFAAYKHCNYDMPKKFVWHTGSDIINIKKYIDALHNRDSVVIDYFEKNGASSKIEYPDLPSASEPPPQIRMSKERLLNLIRGTERLTCRVDTKLTLVTNAKAQKFIIKDFTAFMVAEGIFDKDEFKSLLEEGSQQQQFSQADNTLEKHGVEPRDYHSGVNVREELRDIQTNSPASSRAVSQPTATDATESPVSDNAYGTCREVVTLAKSPWSTFYIRRLVYKGQAILEAWAYALNNEWNVYHRDAARLTALGIEE